MGKFSLQANSYTGWQLKDFDLYTKVDEDHKVQTSSGATVSIIGWVIISILIIGEFYNYNIVQQKEHMIVDTTLGQSLKINVNITFHALTCAEVHLDAMDIAGDNQLNIEHEMIKFRLSSIGKEIGVPGVEIIGELDPPAPEIPADYCGSCYGAELTPTQCCNTCDDLKKAYETKGWNWVDVVKNSTQCEHDKINPFASVRNGEGCRVSGSMLVNKVAGNFHIAHGDSIVRDGRHIHQFIPAEAPHYNISHTIHSISFGEEFPSMPPNPLDKVKRIIVPEVGTGLFQYFIKIIPTVYTDEYNRELNTNQYTITERFRPLSIPDANGVVTQQAVLPGIFFVYELSPFKVEVKRSRIPFSHLFTRLCAIVGGVFSIMGVIDLIIYRFTKLNTKNN